MRQAGEPVDGVDLVDQPLVGDAGGVRPEQAELKVLARVELVRDDAHAVALPVGVFLLEQRNDVRAAPAAGLVDVPTHLDHDDVAELAGLDEVARGLVAGGGAPLGADGDDLVGAFDRLEEVPRVVHAVRGGLLHVGVAAGLDGLHPVARMLEVGGGDEDGVDVVARVQLVVVAHHIDLASGELFDRSRCLFPSQAPDVRDGYQLEIHGLLVGHKGRHIAAQHAVAAADDASAHAVVGAGNLCIARCAGAAGGAGGCDGEGCCAQLYEVSSVGFRCRHG